MKQEVFVEGICPCDGKASLKAPARKPEGGVMCFCCPQSNASMSEDECITGIKLSSEHSLKYNLNVQADGFDKGTLTDF